MKDVAIEAYKGEQWPSRAEHLERLARLGISGGLNPWTRARKTTVYSCRHIPTAFQDSIRSVLLLCTDVFRSLHKTVRALNALELKLIYSLIHNNELMISHGWTSASVSRSKAAQTPGCDEQHAPRNWTCDSGNYMNCDQSSRFILVPRILFQHCWCFLLNGSWDQHKTDMTLYYQLWCLFILEQIGGNYRKEYAVFIKRKRCL